MVLCRNGSQAGNDRNTDRQPNEGNDNSEVTSHRLNLNGWIIASVVRDRRDRPHIVTN